MDEDFYILYLKFVFVFLQWDNVEERIKTIRRYLEQEQLFIKNIQSQYDENPSSKLEREVISLFFLVVDNK